MNEYGTPEDEGTNPWVILACAALVLVAVLMVIWSINAAQGECASKGGQITGRNLCVTPDGRIIP